MDIETLQYAYSIIRCLTDCEPIEGGYPCGYCGLHSHAEKCIYIEALAWLKENEAYNNE